MFALSLSLRLRSLIPQTGSPVVALSAASLFVLGSPLSAQDLGLLYEKHGVFTDDLFGGSVSGAGDVDGDGYEDFIVGSTGEDSGGFTNNGSAFVYSGLDGTQIWRYDGSASDDFLGNAVAYAGDVDGDGFGDFIIGASNADPGGLANAGSAYVYSGLTGVLIWQFDGLAAGDRMGHDVSTAGDVDGDGFDDVVISARYADPGALIWAGSVYVYSGATGSLIWQFDGVDSFDEFGRSVSGGGDVDGDGFDDIIVGTDVANPGGLHNAGSAYVYSGATGSLLYQYDGAVFEHWGRSVFLGGDYDSDGFDDFIVGASEANGGTGSALVYSGNTGTLLWRLDGFAFGDFFGDVVGGGRDVDGDGVDDILVGAYLTDPGGLNAAGSAYVFSGATAALVWQGDGEAMDDWYGNAAAIAGDVDGNGLADVIVGALFTDSGAFTDRGTAYVYNAALHPTLTVTGVCPGLVTITVHDAPPNSRIAFFIGAAGSTTLGSGPCAGLTLDITAPTLVGIFTADAAGSLILTPTLPLGACGLTLQAVAEDFCSLTNSVVL